MSAEIKLTPAEEQLAATLPDGEVLDHLREVGLPNRRVEAWKWSDLRAAMKEARETSGPYTYQAGDDEQLLTELGGVELVIANGLLRAPASLPAAIRVQRTISTPMLIDDAPIASLATASSVTDVAIEQSLEAPLFIRRLSDGQGSHADRVKVIVAPGAELTLIEIHRLSGSPFANALTELKIGHGAKVTRIILQPAADEAISVHTSMVAIHEGATLHQLTLTGGAGFSRHETRLSYEGTADVRLDALYHLQGRNHNDLTSHVTHGVPGAVTRQLVKGIVDDHARSIFQGKFHVAQIGQQTDAQMAHHALVLSGQATVNAKPELEIYADDVECAHGNTVGALDPEALFYLRQRGLDERAAQALLTEAFLSEVIECLPDANLQKVLIENWAAKSEGES